MTENLTDWIALSLVPGLGPKGSAQLIRAFGSAAAVLAASPVELANHGAVRDAILGLRLPHLRPEAEEILRQCEQKHYQAIPLVSEYYPPILKEIADPPLLLYLRGDPLALAMDQVAIVGTRRPSPYGLHVGRQLAEDLAAHGISICSGLARGIDTAAHVGALKGQGKTVAVLGCGIDMIYPKENQKWADSLLAAGGAILSEYPPETFPAPQNFPVRNRIISGLSLGVVIVEASEYSGSLITARMALEQNREVFGVPGNITSGQSVGPNRLIQQGAKLVHSWQDIVEELPFEVRRKVLGRPAKEEQKELPLLNDYEAGLLSRLHLDCATHIDDLFLWENQPMEGIHEALFQLEMKGYVRQLPGKQFVRII